MLDLWGCRHWGAVQFGINWCMIWTAFSTVVVLIVRPPVLHVHSHCTMRFTGWLIFDIWHVAPERSLVIAGHADDDEGGSSVGDVDSDADGDLRAAVLPVERKGGDAADSNTCVQFDTTTTLVRCRRKK